LRWGDDFSRKLDCGLRHQRYRRDAMAGLAIGTKAARTLRLRGEYLHLRTLIRNDIHHHEQLVDNVVGLLLVIPNHDRMATMTTELERARAQGEPYFSMKDLNTENYFRDRNGVFWRISQWISEHNSVVGLCVTIEMVELISIGSDWREPNFKKADWRDPCWEGFEIANEMPYGKGFQ
jgi:hypothetical protein